MQHTKEDAEIQAYIAEEVRLIMDGEPHKNKPAGRLRRAVTAVTIVLLTAALLALVLVRAFADGEAPAFRLPEMTWTSVPLAAPVEPAEDSEQETEESVGTVLVSRYAPVTAEEFDLIARVVYAEANTESLDGQQAVAEVILNRRAAGNFADNIHDVVYAPAQFSTAPMLERVTPNTTNYTAVWLALYGENILPMDVVYFSRGAENGNVWGVIGAHVFCYQYVWG